MHIRSLSFIVHQKYNFYAQNITILPVYNRIYIDGRCKFVPDRFNGDNCYIDPDLPIYWRNWIEYNAESLKETFELVNWVRLNGGTANISLESWMTMDLFMREAVKSAGNEVAKATDKAIREKELKLEKQLESSKEYKSPFEGAPKPSFIP